MDGADIRIFGQRASVLSSTANHLTQSFSYNPASQIGSLTRSNDLYAWTGHTNENLSSTPNGLNQITNVGAKSVTHDGRGNITAVGTDSRRRGSRRVRPINFCPTAIQIG